MKQLIIHTGGHPITATDLKHLNEAYSETIIALVRGLLAQGTTIPNCILYGFEQSPGVPSGTYFSPGAAILDGEICSFAGQTVTGAAPIPPNVRAIVTNDTYLAGNPVTYADASTKNVHLATIATISTVTTPLSANQLLLSGATKFIDILKGNLLSDDSGWMYVGAIGAPAFSGTFSNSWPFGSIHETLRFRRIYGRMAIVQGRFDFDGVGAAASLAAISPSLPLDIFVLPTGFRPDNGSAFCEAEVDTPDGKSYFSIRILSNGRVQIFKAYNWDVSVTPSSFTGTLSTGHIHLHFPLAL